MTPRAAGHVTHRAQAPRPARHGRVVEVHRRRGHGHIYDLLVILWNPTIGLHTHILKLGASKTDATQAADHIAGE